MGEELSWRPGWFEHEGEHLYYEVSGPGLSTPGFALSGSAGHDAGALPAIVLCHGAGGNHATWYQQVAHFAPRARVVTWDQRGYGRSTRVTGDLGPVPATRDLVALLDHLGIQEAHVVGQSMGGWCALGAALEHPERVRSLVLADTLAGIFTPELMDVLVTENRATAPPDPPVLGVHPAIDGLDERDRAQAFLYQQLASFTDEVPPLETVALLLATQYEVEGVRALDAPTLFVFGSNDQLFPPRALRLAAGVVPGARVVEIPGSAHSPYFEDPDAWNAAVDEFLADVESGW